MCCVMDGRELPCGDGVSLYGSGYLRTRSVDKGGGLELTETYLPLPPECWN